MTAIMTEIVGLLTGGLTSFAQAIGGGINAMVTNLFITTTGSGSTATQSLSVFGGVVVIFAGIALTIGLSRWCTQFISKFGK